jgi:subtilase family serine protease
MKRLVWLALLFGCALFAVTGRAASPLEERHARLLRQPLLGPLDDQTLLTLNLVLPWRDESGLDALLRDLYDPHSPLFRQFLSPDEFAGRFGPSPADFQTLEAFARAHGLLVVGRSPSRQYLQVQARVGTIRKALGVTLNRRQRPDGSEFYASEEFPSFQLAGLAVQAIGLDNYSRPKYRHHPARPRSLTKGGRGGTALGPPDFPGSYMGHDFRDLYVPDAPASLSGGGQTIALLEPDGFKAKDITAYETGSNPPLVVSGPPVLRLVDGATGEPDSNAGNIAEVCLDIEMAQAMAPGAQIKVYEIPPDYSFIPGCDDILTAMANDTPLCRQISSSWGEYGDGSTDAQMQQFAAQGQSFFQASGDFGAFSSENSSDYQDQNPADDSPDCLSNYITEVGGTNVTSTNPTPGTTPMISYISETTWNDYQCGSPCTLAAIGNGNDGGGASGGGIFPLGLPAYQTGINANLIAAGGSTTNRNIPDVAMLAESFVVVDSNGTNRDQWQVFDGTSGAAPLMAGFIALVNEQAIVSGKQPGLGLADNAFYALGKGSSYNSVFHDISDSSNDDLNSNFSGGLYPVYYNAVAGYDLCTGWGSPKGMAMVNALVGPLPTGSPTGTPTPTPTFTASPTATETYTDSPTLTDSPTASPTPTVTPTLTASPTSTPVPLGQLFVYPNPARDQATAEYKADHAEGLRVVIFDLAGESVLEVNRGQAAVGKNLIPLRLSKLAPGIYWVELLADEGAGYQPRSHFKLAIVRP